jgi:hypothetical protein
VPAPITAAGRGLTPAECARRLTDKVITTPGKL